MASLESAVMDVMWHTREPRPYLPGTPQLPHPRRRGALVHDGHDDPANLREKRLLGAC